ncbi:1-acyl-sn-glycerol-3-phosphate acyltransferase [bacterium]|nr:1-acyl-sn-glycerol-3-phosphate acyltransferase [bacterium]MBP9810542.1 1-acyl-sn-glycerol-3-phosphate acyltransferase [bacterium]
MKIYFFTLGLKDGPIAQFFAAIEQKFVWQYAQRCLTSGFVPTAFLPLQFIGKLLAKLWIFIQVGRVKIVGKEHLDSGKRIVFCANHVSMFDPILVYSLLKCYPRYMTAIEEMTGFGGLKAVFMGACGSFAVDRSKGKTVIEPAIDVLVKGDSLVIFPEGKIGMNGPYKQGSAIIALGAAAKLAKQEQVGIVPIHLFFHGFHSQSAKGPYGAMKFDWRHGVTVTVGAPIWLDSDVILRPEQLTEIVRHQIVDQLAPRDLRSSSDWVAV